MKIIAIIFALAIASFADRPAWVDSNETTWKNSGKIYVKIHVVSKDLDAGMNSTGARFRDELTAHYCPTDGVCMYYNFTAEGSYREMSDSTTWDIYRLYSIKDLDK